MANTTRQGDLAEVGFLYRATEEGFTVGRPFGGDVRYDAMLDGGRKVHRVQVKSTVRLCRKDVYEVRIGRQVERGKLGPKAVAYTKADIDFLAVLVVPEGAWYIFPVEELRGRTRLTLNSARHKRAGVNAGARERWEAFRVGRFPSPGDLVALNVQQEFGTIRELALKR